MAYFLPIALVNAATFWLATRMSRRAAWAAYGVALLLLLFKAVLHQRPDWEFALFPWPDYVFFQGWVFYPIALGCLGLGANLLDGRNRRAVLVLAAFVFLVSLWTERWLVQAPDTSSGMRADEQHHCAQSTTYSCGPAACVSLLSCLGITTTEGEMMGLCRTPPYGGTSLFRIARGLRLKVAGRPYRVEIVDGDPDALRKRRAPAIVTVNRVHVIAVRFDGDEAVILDPARGGAKRIPFADYREQYGGFAVVVMLE